MKKRLNAYRPSPAMVVALLALFVSLGGVSYGVASGSIDSREIKNSTIRSKDIRNRTVQSKDVKKNGLGGSVVAESKLGKIPLAAEALHAADSSTLGGNGPGAFFPAAKILTFQRFTLTNNQTRKLVTN